MKRTAWTQAQIRCLDGERKTACASCKERGREGKLGEQLQARGSVVLSEAPGRSGDRELS